MPWILEMMAFIEYSLLVLGSCCYICSLVLLLLVQFFVLFNEFAFGPFVLVIGPAAFGCFWLLSL